MKVITAFSSRCKVCYKFTKNLKDSTCYECIACSGKESFKSLNIARSVADWYNQSENFVSINGYRCTYCNKFHLGNSSYLTAS